MNELQVFSSPEFGVIRTVTINDEPWFVGKDVAEALGYSKPMEAVNTNVEEVDSTVVGVTDALGRDQQTKVINESGLYDLIFESRLPSAKRFRHWVTSEVLPSIRKTGRYETSDAKHRRLTLEAQLAINGIPDELLPYVKSLLVTGDTSLLNIKPNHKGRIIVSSDEDIKAIDRALEAYAAVHNYYSSGGRQSVTELKNSEQFSDLQDIGVAILNSAQYFGRKKYGVTIPPTKLSFNCQNINKGGKIHIPKIGTFDVDPELIMDINEQPSMGYITKDRDGNYIIEIGVK